ncbi:hypothetical protein P7F60_24190, partial [Rhizobium sp. YJ-22]|uniref:hypothetical protein n=1 Tax=Rhizobium sp. YJ-22 TaxID=3037556 RepID=UPI0024122B1D
FSEASELAFIVGNRPDNGFRQPSRHEPLLWPILPFPQGGAGRAGARAQALNDSLPPAAPGLP